MIFLHLLVWWIPVPPQVLFWNKTGFDHVAKTLLFDKVIFLFVENKNILILCFHKNAALKKALLHSSSWRTLTTAYARNLGL